jgi:hypothetical protein
MDEGMTRFRGPMAYGVAWGIILCLKVSSVSIWFKHSFCLERVVDIIMKRAELGLLEVLGLVVNAGRGGMCRGELRILLTSIFGANKPYFLAGGHYVFVSRE